MNLSILHVSDLHRDADNPIRNDVLLDSLENDRRHYSSEETSPVRSPDLIIVSGDIIHGVGIGATDAELKIAAQYDEALDFLGQLADQFVGGDRNRIIVVPGNHDVSAHVFKQSLAPIDIPADRKRDLVTQLFSHESRFRWSWSDFELYEIADEALYMRRLTAFAEFYSNFYGGARTYDLSPEKQMDLFDFPAYDLTVAAFSSCHNNDLYNRQGAIHPGCIAEAGNKLREAPRQTRLRIGVWHHNTEGLPTHADYMDPDVLQNMIDRGFSLGFHGHQHRPQFLETKFRHGTDRKMMVISAGTLCGGPSFRYGRAYNVIEVDTENRKGRLHVREMQNDNLRMPIWGPRALPPNSKPYYDFEYDAPPEPEIYTNQNTLALIQAQRLYELGNWDRAVDVLVRIADPLARPLLLDCLVRSNNTTALCSFFDPPANDAEAIHLIDALWAEGRRDRLGEVLTMRLVSESMDPSIVEMRVKYAARLK